MRTENTYLIPIIVNVIFTTIIITIYGYLIYRAVKKYSQKSHILRQNLEDFKSHQVQLLLKTELEIQEQTFQFISKEIHDNVTQGLSLAKLNLNVIDLENLSESKLLIHKSNDLIAKALSDLNHLSKSLDADLIESYGLIHATKYEISRWERIAKNEIEFEVIGALQFMATNSELLIFRIIQESINNIIKYANAENIKISIIYSNEDIVILIKDDGVGFNPETIFYNKKIGQMAGLKNMRKRAESLDGKLIIDSKLGLGTTLKVCIPLNNKINKDDQNSTGRRPQIVA